MTRDLVTFADELPVQVQDRRRGRARVAARLAAQGVPVRIGSRSASPTFEWHDESTWAAAVDGIARCYVSYHPDLASPGAARRIEAFTRMAMATPARCMK